MAERTEACAARDGSAERVLQLSHWLGALKHLKRTGWVKEEVPQPETVASHMYRMSALAMTLCDAGGPLDRDKCIRMCLAHDMAECIVGDITPHCGVTETDKHDREKEAMRRLCALVPSANAADELMSLWLEYEENRSDEAKFVHDLDKFDMIHQAFEYEQETNRAKGLQEFFDSTDGIFQSDLVKPLVAHLKAHRDREH